MRLLAVGAPAAGQAPARRSAHEVGKPSGADRARSLCSAGRAECLAHHCRWPRTSTSMLPARAADHCCCECRGSRSPSGTPLLSADRKGLRKTMGLTDSSRARKASCVRRLLCSDRRSQYPAVLALMGQQFLCTAEKASVLNCDLAVALATRALTRLACPTALQAFQIHRSSGYRR